MSIPLSVVNQLRSPEGAARLQSQYGGTQDVDRDGSIYASVGDRPIPPPKALRSIHAHRQEERKQREEDREAEAFEQEHGLGVKESRTSLHFENDGSAEAVRRRRELAQRELDAPLSETPYEYEIQGCGVAECNGAYEYSAASSHGAPVYQSKAGWTLHRGRPPVESTIGTGEEVIEFGWIISKGGKPFYAAKTDAMLAPGGHWECFYGPPPPPSQVLHTSWEKHLVESCGPLKDAGNVAIQQGKHEKAQDRYAEALRHMDGYGDVVASSETLRKLREALLANRAEACLRLRQWSQALEDSSRVLTLAPGHVKAAVRLFKACRALGRWGDAVGPLERVLDELGPRGNAEVRSLLDEAALLASCEAGDSKLSALYGEMRHLRRELDRQEGGGVGGQELRPTAQALATSLRRLEDGLANDKGLQRDLRLLLQGTGVLDAALAAACDSQAGEWGVELLAACAGPHLREEELRRALEALPAAAQQLVEHPAHALELVRRLLKHRARQQLKVADAIVEARGVLAGCLRPWAELMDARYGDEPDERPVEVVHELGAQVLRLDNVEALALALFVECFVGKKVESGVTGGFSLYLGGGVRQVVLELLRRWSEDARVLRSLAPELVARAWGATLAKLRRDAGVEVEKALPSGQGGKKPLKLEWFKLKDAASLHKGVGAFYPEDFVVGVLGFLRAHLEATCERGCEREVRSGIAARHPAEEWMDEVLDRPFAWGVLLPLVMAPGAVASAALGLLEALIQRHPHSEKLAKRLAGLHVFMPLLGLPWPQAQPARSHVDGTLALGPVARRSLCAVLRCTLDTEMGLRVARDTVGRSMQAVLKLLDAVLKDHDQPESLIAVIEVLGILTGNLDCWDEVPAETVSAILEEFMHSTHKPTRNQLAKLMRLMHADRHVGPHLQAALEDARFGLDEEQQATALREIFDVKTLAGQAQAERMMEMAREQEQTPADAMPSDRKTQKQSEAIVDALCGAYLRGRNRPRVLVMGRTGRALSRCFGELHNSCRVVLGETTLEKLNRGDLGPSVQPVLLPVPQGVEGDAELSSQEHFDLVLVGEPMGYFEVGEYAEKLKSFIKRREKEDDRETDQVQWVCIEQKERLEDARDELYSAGYYKADHDKAFDRLRKAALKTDHDVALFALSSYEKERRKLSEDQRAVERKARREREEAAQAVKDEENEQRRNVLYETLFDPLLSPPEAEALPVAFAAGAPREEAELVLFWLHGNAEGPEAHRPMLEELAASAGGRLRIVAATFPEGRSEWYPWSDEVAVNFGMEFYEMHEGPTDEAIEKAQKEPAKNTSFGKPSFEEMRCLEDLEVGCKQLLILAEEEAAGMAEGARLAFGGFAQGGGVAAYAALSGTASEEVLPRIRGLLPCCAGVPVFHFLASKMQVACLASKEQGVHQQPIHVHMVYAKVDAQVKESFVETTRDLYKRFDFPATLTRFQATPEERFPKEAALEHLRMAVRTWMKPA